MFNISFYLFSWFQEESQKNWNNFLKVQGACPDITFHTPILLSTFAHTPSTMFFIKHLNYLHMQATYLVSSDIHKILQTYRALG
jgi:hypothetical protein